MKHNSIKIQVEGLDNLIKSKGSDNDNTLALWEPLKMFAKTVLTHFTGEPLGTWSNEKTEERTIGWPRGWKKTCSRETSGGRIEISLEYTFFNPMDGAGWDIKTQIEINDLKLLLSSGYYCGLSAPFSLSGSGDLKPKLNIICESLKAGFGGPATVL